MMNSDLDFHFLFVVVDVAIAVLDILSLNYITNNNMFIFQIIRLWLAQ